MIKTENRLNFSIQKFAELEFGSNDGRISLLDRGFNWFFGLVELCAVDLGGSTMDKNK